MTALRLVAGTSLPPPIPSSPALAWRSALRSVEYWDDAVYLAHLGVIDAAPGRMLAAVEVWREAERQLVAAHLRERRARCVAGGRPWLRLVGVAHA